MEKRYLLLWKPADSTELPTVIDLEEDPYRYLAVVPDLHCYDCKGPIKFSVQEIAEEGIVNTFCSGISNSILDWC